ncbi:MAG: 30S ribosome-binding factor RbfA [Gammaproteobacteria bacterium]|nr:30S ribosome-binding factor RbfA [Gammaproteobacteria bacterium]MCW8923765.1 30S ribosome-binding factor RbfA [Gammaproteobacteria bacterium]
MPREFSRSQRMAEQIRRDLAEIVRDELKDPRMGFVSFTAVKLSRDLGNAVIYCSVIEQDKQAETLETLNRATGFLRSKLAARMRSRTVPVLKFINDDSVTRGAAMEDLIRKAIGEDESKSAEDTSDGNND